jgi:two-component system nitrogen regulation sensor histidine kinase GlnL
MDGRPGDPLSLRIAEYLDTGILALDERLAIRYVNPSAEQLIGRSRQQLVGRELVDAVPGAGELQQTLRTALESDDPLASPEVSIDLAPDNEPQQVIDCHVSFGQLDDGHGVILLELRDASHRLRLHRESSLLSQLEASRAIVRQLAHEIRNPLGGIRGAAQLLDRALPGDEHHEYTEVIIREADRLARLVGDLLGPGTPPAPEPVNIHEVLEHIRTLTSADAPAGVHILRDYDPSMPVVRIDRGQTVQILLNLVRNAVEASGDSGRVLLRTRVLTHCSIGSTIHRLVSSIEVVDKGSGVPDTIRETLFYPLVSGRSGGTGLGLALAQELASRQGGVIDYSSKPGRTIFRLLLPIDDT